jgi:hypothetical protein
MEEDDFEGTLVLERLAEIGALERFFERIDADDFEGVERLLRAAKIDRETTGWVLRKMRDGDGEH